MSVLTSARQSCLKKASQSTGFLSRLPLLRHRLLSRLVFRPFLIKSLLLSFVHRYVQELQEKIGFKNLFSDLCIFVTCSA